MNSLQNPGRSYSFTHQLFVRPINDVTSVLYRGLLKLRPPLALALFCFSLQTILTTIYDGKISIINSSILLPSIFLLILVIIDLTKKVVLYGNGERRSFSASLKESLIFFHHWVPPIILIYSYQNLKNIVHHWYAHSITDTLIAIDDFLFGIQPTLWFENHVHPLLTEYFAFTYALYFVLPFTLTILFYLRREITAFYDLNIGMILCFYLGLFGYFAFPASPPRFSIQDQYCLTTLPGWFYNTAQTYYDKASMSAQFGAFPSLHVALSTLALLYAFRYRSLFYWRTLLFWTLLPFVLSLWISTVYLRHHWTADIAAGWLLALFTFLVSKQLTNRWLSLDRRAASYTYGEETNPF